MLSLALLVLMVLFIFESMLVAGLSKCCGWQRLLQQSNNNTVRVQYLYMRTV